MDRKGALWYHVYPIILLVIDPCFVPLCTGLLLHPYGWLTRQLQLAAQVPYASFRNDVNLFFFSRNTRNQTVLVMVARVPCATSFCLSTPAFKPLQLRQI